MISWGSLWRAGLGLSLSDASAFASRGRNRYWNDYVKRNEEGKRRLIHPQGVVTDYQSRRFESYDCYLSRSKSKKAARLAGRLRLRPSLHRVAAQLNDREYEALCCCACKACGAHQSLTPKMRRRRGIDFFALFDVPQGYLGCTGLGRIRVVGQAKQHDRRIPPGHIREFNDTLHDVRKRSDSVIDLIPQWFTESSAPIVGWFASHAGFQEGSLSKARSNGIMLLDSRTLVEMIALAPATAPEMSGASLSEKRLVDSCKQMTRESR